MVSNHSIREALTFDDVLLVPAESDIVPANVDVRTKLTRTIELGMPLISAAMDTVTESEMAIAMAQHGGIGVIHRNMEPQSQLEQVRRVKRFESGIVENPITINPDAPLADALDLMRLHRISGIPVVDPKNGKLLGILTNRDVRFAEDMTVPVKMLMTRDNLVTVRKNVEKDQAQKLFHQHRIEKLLVVDDDYRCIGLMTVKDIEKARLNPFATKDKNGRLRVAAAIGTGTDALERTALLSGANIDAVVVDTAHGHAQSVLDTIKALRRDYGTELQIIAGNVATKSGAQSLIKAGVDAIKVGIGPGSICTTRIIAGVGIPQLTAIMDVCAVARKKNIPVIADGGIKYSGDIAKAIAGGADVVMLGSLLAGTDEAPGEIILFQGRSFKTYRGMGSLGAFERGSADRYFQQNISDALTTGAEKFVPEGIEGRVPYKGAAIQMIYQLLGGLKAAMGYTGNGSLKDLQEKAEFVRMSRAGMNESHVHGVQITKEPPNYWHSEG